MNVTCVGYAAASDETLIAIEQRGHGLQRAPELGNASGLPWQLYCMGHPATSLSARKLAQRDGMIPLQVAPYDSLPQLPAGQRLVVMFFASIDNRNEYHWLRGHEGTFTSKMGHDAMPQMTDSRGRFIRDPRDAHIYNQQEGPFFFALEEKGLDMRLRPEMEELMDIILIEQRLARQSSTLVQPSLAANFMKLAKVCERLDPAVTRGLVYHAEYYRTGKRPDALKLG